MKLAGPLRTPLLSYDDRIFLKPENLQPYGSYKIRGVHRAFLSAPEAQLKQGLFAASAGNMAQPVAALAAARGYPCRIYVPDSAPEIKKDAIRKLGAQLLELPFAQLWEMVRTPPLDRPGLFIHPVFTPGLLEGYGSLADEILQDAPNVDAVIVPFGVGGLSLGLARGFQRLGQNVQIYACEPETAAPFQASMREGRPMAIERKPSFVDAIGTPEVLPEVFAELQAHGVRSLVLSLDEITTALRILFDRQKLVCEGAGAAALAGALQIAQRSEHKNIVSILSGGNISGDVFMNLYKTV